MKRTFFVLFVTILLISCKKTIETDNPTITKNKIESGTNGNTSRESLDTVPVLLSETSPGVYETVQNYKGAHLVFTNLQTSSSHPFAKLTSARSFGTPPGTNLYNIVIEGLIEQGYPQRSFTIQTFGCTPVVKGFKTLIPQTTYNSLAPQLPAPNVFSYLNSSPIFNTGEITFNNLNDEYKEYENSMNNNYSITVKYGTFSNCNTVKIVTGKIIARRKNTTYPYEYNFYVAPLSNYKEDVIINGIE